MVMAKSESEESHNVNFFTTRMTLGALVTFFITDLEVTYSVIFSNIFSRYYMV